MTLTLTMMLLLLLGAIAASLLLGSTTIPVSDAWEALTGHADSASAQVIRSLRLPRTLTGIAVGAALGLAGLLIQALTRNPLADPGLIGISSGAALAVTAGVLLGLPARGFGAFGAALVGALAITAAVSALGGSAAGIDPVRLVLAGVAITAVFAGITTAMTLVAPVAFETLRDWNVGSLLAARPEQVGWMLPWIAAGTLACLGLARPLDALALGEEIAAAQGVKVRATRLTALGTVAVLTATATALAGPILFAALIIPHIARLLVGTGHARLTLCCLALGPVLILVADVVGRVVVLPGELAVGVMTALIGAPILVVLIRSRGVVAP
ncbi:MAG: iron ABC transporter permease [Propionicimonas sp.]